MQRDKSVRVIVTAAERGGRMKSKLPKALIKINGKPIITHNPVFTGAGHGCAACSEFRGDFKHK